MFITSSKREESEYVKAVKSIFEEEEDVFAAVAFWGNGADSIINPRPGQTIKLICNLASGATNPDVIKILLNREGVDLKQHDRLHAKVIVGSKKALVGSANLSNNGLNLEGNELCGWEEAGLITTDHEHIEAIKKWFMTMWAQSRSIEKSDLDDARRKWEERRKTRIICDPVPCDFSLGEFSPKQLADRRIYLVIYREDLSAEAKDAYRKAQEQQTGQKIPKDDKSLPIYEDWPKFPEEEAVLIDLYYRANGALECYGALKRTHDLKFKRKDGAEGHLVVCRKEDYVLGYPFKTEIAKEKFAKELQAHIEDIWNSELAHGDNEGKYIDLADVVSICG